MRTKYEFTSILAPEFLGYFALRGSQGHQHNRERNYFKALDRHLVAENLAEKVLTPAIVEGWLRSFPDDMSVNTKIVYISHYTQFAKYLGTLGIAAFIPERPVDDKSYVPYVFSADEEEKAIAGSAWNANDIVFCSNVGTYIEPRRVCTTMDKITDAAGLPHFTFHALRHTFATRMLEAEVPAKVVAEILGHKDVTLTLNTYSHVLTSTAHAQIEKIDKLFQESEVGAKPASLPRISQQPHTHYQTTNANNTVTTKQTRKALRSAGLWVLRWSSRPGLNRLPRPYQGRALPFELREHKHEPKRYYHIGSIISIAIYQT